MTTWLENLKNPARWRASAKDVLIWFLAGLLLTSLLSTFSPGRLILVRTNSIQEGLYWLDYSDTWFQRGDFATFRYNPRPQWLQDRYGRQLHTKMVAGVAGDTVYADDARQLKVCTPSGNCTPVGTVQLTDSKGRPMQSFVQPGQPYLLQPGEVWVHGPNEKSLDSRYHGPVPTQELMGKAHPLLLW